MAGFGHGPATSTEAEDPALAARNARYGLALFAIYFAIYAAFVGLNAFNPAVMSVKIGGVNLAIVYGLGLIVTALVLALVYCWLCRATTAPVGETGEAASGRSGEGGNR